MSLNKIHRTFYLTAFYVMCAYGCVYVCKVCEYVYMCVWGERREEKQREEYKTKWHRINVSITQQASDTLTKHTVTYYRCEVSYLLFIMNTYILIYKSKMYPFYLKCNSCLNNPKNSNQWPTKSVVVCIQLSFSLHLLSSK